MKEQTARLPISSVAEKLNSTQLNILMHIKRGLLQGVEEDGVWFIDVSSLEEFLAKSGGNKAEDICASSCAKKHVCGGGCS
jgi:hypothetical protein